MSDQSESVTGQCHECGDTATLSASGPDGVFRPVCMECFEEMHQSNTSGLLSLQQEGILLLVAALGIIISMVGIFFFPEAYPFPEWVPTGLFLCWFVFFFGWAVRGGMPSVH